MGTKQKKVEKAKPAASQNKSFISGIILITLGLFFLLDSLNIIAFSFDYVMLIIGLIFLLIYISTKSPGVLIPGVMLSLFGLIIIFGISYLPYLWTLSIALSFFAVYITKRKDTAWALIPGAILLSISVIILFNYYTSIDAFPIILIVLGSYLIYKNYYGAKK